MVHIRTRQIEAPPPKSIRRSVEPTADIVSLAAVKKFVRIGNSVSIHDDELLGLIRSATMQAEDFTKRAFIQQTWVITFDALLFDFFSIPDIPRLIEIPRPRLISLDEVRFFKEDGTEEVFDLNDLTVDTNSEPGRVVLKRGVTWPTGLRDIDAVKLTYKAGYGTKASDVPETIKLGVKQMISTWFENHEDIVVGVSVSEIPRGSRMTLMPYRIMTL